VPDDITPSTAVEPAAGAVGRPPAAPATPAASPGEQLAALSEDERAVLAKVAEIVRKIQFGTVVLVIQDAKVVQIEMAEKFRLR
jgi:hypothetical protein